MKTNLLLRYVLVLMLISTNFPLQARSPLRARRNPTPTITTHWSDDTKPYKITHSHLGIYPFFHLYDPSHLRRYELPDSALSFHYEPGKTVLGSRLKQLINELLVELNEKKQRLTHFKILQSKDYNFDKNWGLLVLKFRDYPYVLKLFIETPEGIVNPFNKGIEPIFFFYMGSGVSRHLTGFTRIKNREIVLRELAKNPQLANQVEIPNKWFWIPTNSRMITIRGDNFADRSLESTIPGTYVIVADCIEPERPFSLSSPQDRSRSLTLCNKMNLMIDPHIKNFMIDKRTHSLVIVDTEHFPTATGLYSKGPFKSYLHWYFHLTSKCIKDVLFLTKRERLARQRMNPVRALGMEDLRA